MADRHSALQPTVLLISDRVAEQQQLTEALTRIGARVVCCDEGTGGIAEVYQCQPDLVIVPGALDDLDGYQLCRLLRNDLSTRHLIIVLLVEANGFPQPWRTEVGADLVLDRDTPPSELAATCQRLLAEQDDSERPEARSAAEQQLRERREQWNRRVNFILEEKLYRTTLVSRVNAGLCRFEEPVANRRAVLGHLAQALDFDAALLLVEGDRRCMVSLRTGLSESALRPLMRLLQDQMAAQGELTLEVPREVRVILGEENLGEAEATLASLSCSAMRVGDRLIGFVAVGRIQPNAFSPDEATLLDMFAVQAAAVLENSLLNERNAVLAAALQNLADAVLLTDLHEVIIHANPAACTLFDVAPDQLHGHRVRKVFAPGFPAEQVGRILDQGLVTGWSGEIEGHRHDEAFPMSLQLTPVRSRGGRVIGLVLSAHDLTQNKQLEQERLRAAELTTLLETAVALNHEINNPLQAILSCAQLLQFQLRDLAQPEVQDKLRLIMEQSQRIAEVTRKLEHAKAAVRRPYVVGRSMIDIDASSQRG